MVIVITDQNTDLFIGHSTFMSLFKNFNFEVKKIKFCLVKDYFVYNIRAHTLIISQSHMSNRNKFVWKQKIIEQKGAYLWKCRVLSWSGIRKHLAGHRAPHRFYSKGVCQLLCTSGRPTDVWSFFFLTNGTHFPLSQFPLFLSFFLFYFHHMWVSVCVSACVLKKERESCYALAKMRERER